jgi:hypothetical protein
VMAVVKNDLFMSAMFRSLLANKQILAHFRN